MTRPLDAWPAGDLLEWWDDETRTYHDFLNEETRPYTDEEDAAADARDAERAAAGEREALVDGMRDALADNQAFLDLDAPTNAQTLAQVEALTRQMSAMARLLPTDDTAATPRLVVDGMSRESVAAMFEDHGVRAGDPARTLDPNDYVKVQSSHDDPAGMVIWTQKVAGDSDDVNVDGSVIVKHGKDYTGTPGYADTLQVYTLAGSAGTIVGNNDFDGYESTLPYAPGAVDGAGYVRFELGPIWPRSEAGRFNNSGDLMLGGWHYGAGSGLTYTQSGTTVTQVTGNDAFTPADVGRYMLWDGPGGDGHADRITGFIDATRVTVERSRTITSPQAASVRIPATLIRPDSTIETFDGLKVRTRNAQVGGFTFEIQSPDGSYSLAVDHQGRPRWSSDNTQDTVGGPGPAAAPPATPHRWLKVVDSDGTVLVIPAYRSGPST